MSRVVLVGSGGAPYRRYAMEALAAEHDLLQLPPCAVLEPVPTRVAV